MVKCSVLVGTVPRVNLWEIIQKEKWYHIPVGSALEGSEFAEYLGFYFPDVFEEELQHKVIYYAKVVKVEKVKRIELFPAEKDHKNANKDYFKFYLESIEKLPEPILSVRRWRGVIFIPTNYEKLFTAKEINDLYDTSPLEEEMYLEMKKRGIAVERQFFVKINEQAHSYCLDFGILCRNGKIDLECDGEEYHSSPEAVIKDKERDRELKNQDWKVIRFSGKEIRQNMDACIKEIEGAVEKLEGIAPDNQKLY